MQKFKHSNATFWVIFKHCAVLLIAQCNDLFLLELPWQNRKSQKTVFQYVKNVDQICIGKYLTYLTFFTDYINQDFVLFMVKYG